MHSTHALFLICLVAAIIEVTHTQSIQVIQVGDTGSFFDPQVINARKGDMVSFQWTGMFHSVTQSSFENPCTPLAGGFDSGVTGNPPQQLLLPEWNLTITDDTQPIWFFCKVTHPVSHCTSGMVGAINANIAIGNQSFNNFVQAAKLLTNPPTLPTGMPPALTGIGAMATAMPIPVHNMTLNTSSISNTSTSSTTTTTSAAISTTSTSTNAPPVNTSNSSGLATGAKGGIAGGVVGGVVLLTLLVLLFMSYRRGRRYRKEAESTKVLRSQSSRDMSHLDRSDLLYIGGQQSSMHGALRTNPMHRSQGSVSVIDSLERDSGGPNINVKELAAEIAKNIRQDMSPQDRAGFSLSPVPEQLVASAVSRLDGSRGGEFVQRTDTGGTAESPRTAESTQTGTAESMRGTDSTRVARQLPMPPQKRSDVHSVETLPAYVPGR